MNPYQPPPPPPYGNPPPPYGNPYLMGPPPPPPPSYSLAKVIVGAIFVMFGMGGVMTWFGGQGFIREEERHAAVWGHKDPDIDVVRNVFTGVLIASILFAVIGLLLLLTAKKKTGPR